MGVQSYLILKVLARILPIGMVHLIENSETDSIDIYIFESDENQFPRFLMVQFANLKHILAKQESKLYLFYVKSNMYNIHKSGFVACLN